jgi:hypothetical protein
MPEFRFDHATGSRIRGGGVEKKIGWTAEFGAKPLQGEPGPILSNIRQLAVSSRSCNQPYHRSISVVSEMMS